MRISVFGIGYVGAVACGCLARMGHEVVGVDVAGAKVALLGSGRSPIVEAQIGEIIADAVSSGRLTATSDVEAAVARTELSFIAVGTPSGPDGALSMAAVEQVCAAIGRGLRDKPTPHAVVMRSTVPPGTGDERALPILIRESGRAPGQGLDYYSNPEFLREGTAVADFHAPPMTLIGAVAGDDAAVLRALYAPIPGAVHVVPLRVAESVKYLSNAYHAVKLAFANEAGQVLAAHGVDAPEAFRLFREDRVLNVSPAYLRPGFAFGGSCLPKDVRGILALGAMKHVATPFLSSVLPSNDALVESAFARIAAGGRQKIALFGLAFKPGTDDLRESPFVALAERLIGRGYELAIFDRHVQVARLVGSNRAYIEREIPHLERLLATDAAVTARDCRTAVIGHVGDADLPALCAALTDQRVIDLACVPALRSLTGIAYEGICW